MRSLCGLTLSLSLLFVLSTSQAGLARRRYRDVQTVPKDPALPMVLSEPLVAELGRDQIAVQVVKVLEPVDAVEPVQNLIEDSGALVAVSGEPGQVVDEIVAPQTQTVTDAQNAATSFEADVQKKLEDVVTEMKQEHNQLAAVEKNEVTEIQSDSSSVVKESIQAKPELPTASVPTDDEAKLNQVKGLFVVNEVPSSAGTVGALEPIESPAEEALASVRQATQATPAQTSTQQNFVQQLIQPLGQFISQFTGSQQQQTAGQVVNDEPIAPGPTIPGFLNPANAITSAQHAVQNVVNSTSQAFQGLQQLATNLGTSFQNTLSNLGGQQNQLSTSDSTTTRPPGPIQAIVSNLIGGNPQASPVSPEQPQGPLQGIISFFQGGNRPQSTVLQIAPSSTQPPRVEAVSSSVVSVDAGVDDKIGATDQSHEHIQQDSNEVRKESTGDSFEESQPDQMIVVNDEVEQQEAA